MSVVLKRLSVVLNRLSVDLARYDVLKRELAQVQDVFLTRFVCEITGVTERNAAPNVDFSMPTPRRGRMARNRTQAR